jgi:hypothetical protein
MPWKISKRSGKFCVINQTSGKEEDCHATRTEASDHMAALYASEGKKEVLMDKHEGEIAYRPAWGATSFAELQANMEAAEAASKVRDLTWHFQDMVSNIMVSDDVDDKGAAIKSLADEFATLVEAEAEKSRGKSFWLKVKELILGKEKEEAVEKPTSEPDELKEDTNSFMVWKEGEQWRWIALYSNKFRDQDSPPEILSEAAHKGFVKAVDDGEWEHPELWLWHIPGTKCGYCDFVAYDDRGFAVASGVVTDEKVAEGLAARDDLKTSHGMPSAEIKRDPEDSTILTRYRSKEISPLPGWAAANKLTTFSMGGNMAFPKDKREFLVDLMGEEKTAALEADLGTKAKEADGMEYKEADAADEAKAAETEETQEAAAEEEAPEGDPPVEPQYVTREELVEEVGGMFAEYGEQIQALQATVEGLGKSLKELQRSDEEKVAQKAEETPAASLGDLLRHRAVGSDEARVDGRTKEARVGPKETSPIAADGPTPSTFLNAMMAASQGQVPQ